MKASLRCAGTSCPSAVDKIQPHGATCSPAAIGATVPGAAAADGLAPGKILAPSGAKKNSKQGAAAPQQQRQQRRHGQDAHATLPGEDTAEGSGARSGRCDTSPSAITLTPALSLGGRGRAAASLCRNTGSGKSSGETPATPLRYVGLSGAPTSRYSAVGRIKAHRRVAFLRRQIGGAGSGGLLADSRRPRLNPCCPSGAKKNTKQGTAAPQQQRQRRRHGQDARETHGQDAHATLPGEDTAAGSGARSGRCDTSPSAITLTPALSLRGRGRKREGERGREGGREERKSRMSPCPSAR